MAELMFFFFCNKIDPTRTKAHELEGLQKEVKY